MKSFLLNVSYFTRLPVGNHIEYTDELYKKSTKWFPYVGLIIGAILLCPLYIFPNADRGFLSVIQIILYLILSGGIHLDGYADSIDGLLSHRSKEEILIIMKDSRIGAFGAIGLIIYFITFKECMGYLSGQQLILMPYIGKLCAAIAASFSQDTREKTGMGTIFIESQTHKSAFIHLFIALILMGLLVGHKGIILLIVTLLFAFISKLWIENKIDGLTGDSLGLIVESSQIVFMILCVLL